MGLGLISRCCCDEYSTSRVALGVRSTPIGTERRAKLIRWSKWARPLKIDLPLASFGCSVNDTRPVVTHAT
eukprot:86232-Prymnesium_polylepis.1